jgi:hypothetical protein
MAKFKLARGKTKKPMPQGGLPCVIIVIVGILFLMLSFFWWAKNAGG